MKHRRTTKPLPQSRPLAEELTFESTQQQNEERTIDLNQIFDDLKTLMVAIMADIGNIKRKLAENEPKREKKSQNNTDM